MNMSRKDIALNRILSVALMDLGFVTHAVHANARMVYLNSQQENSSLMVQGPPNAGVYPPGPGWIYVIVNGVPSEGVLVMVGDSTSPPVNAAALAK